MIFNGNPLPIFQMHPLHIDYDPDLIHEYKIIRSCTSDGTLAHAYSLIAECLTPLFKMESTFKPTEPKNWEDVTGMKYVIGNLKIEMLEVPKEEIDPEKWWLHTRFTGELPVKVTYVMKEKKNETRRD